MFESLSGYFLSWFQGPWEDETEWDIEAGRRSPDRPPLTLPRATGNAPELPPTDKDLEHGGHPSSLSQTTDPSSSVHTQALHGGSSSHPEISSQQSPASTGSPATVLHGGSSSHPEISSEQSPEFADSPATVLHGDSSSPSVNSPPASTGGGLGRKGYGSEPKLGYVSRILEVCRTTSHPTMKFESLRQLPKRLSRRMTDKMLKHERLIVGVWAVSMFIAAVLIISLAPTDECVVCAFLTNDVNLVPVHLWAGCFIHFLWILYAIYVFKKEERGRRVGDRGKLVLEILFCILFFFLSTTCTDKASAGLALCFCLWILCIMHLFFVVDNFGIAEGALSVVNCGLIGGFGNNHLGRFLVALAVVVIMSVKYCLQKRAAKAKEQKAKGKAIRSE